MRRRRLSYPRENLKAIRHSLYWTEVRKMDQQLFAAGRKAPHASLFGVWPIRFNVDKVRDHADPIHAEYVRGAEANEFADAGNAVRLLDRKLGNRKIGTVRPHQRDVGAVQRRNE